MKTTYALLIMGFISCLFSCGSKNNDPKSPLVAKWNLQKQHIVLTDNHTQVLDTILTPSGTTKATAQFNSNGSYTTASVYVADPNSLSSIISPSSENSSGTYTYANNSFTISSGLAGWFVFVTGSSTLASNYSFTSQITSVNNNSLVIHTNSIFTVTNNGTHNYVEALDYYYTKE